MIATVYCSHRLISSFVDDVERAERSIGTPCPSVSARVATTMVSPVWMRPDHSFHDADGDRVLDSIAHSFDLDLFPSGDHLFNKT